VKSKKRKATVLNSKLFQIIDVNVNRSVEGLRVVEEICRFILEDNSLTHKIKICAQNQSVFNRSPEAGR